MTPNNNNIPFFFSVKHIIKPNTSKLIYGIHHNDLDYFLQKTYGIDDCEQLDDNPRLDPDTFKTICEVISEIEKGYKKVPPLEFINMDIFNIIVKASTQDHSKERQDR
ncbi:MAG: hypothetical protein ACXVI9_04240 [Mucilaginibacter sp.]